MTYKDKFINKLTKLNSKLLSEYSNANTKVDVSGTCGHTINRTPDKIIRTIDTSGDLKCTLCSRIRTQESKDTSHENIKKEIESLGGKLLSRYKMANEKIEILCACGHKSSKVIASIRKSYKALGKLSCRDCSYKELGLTNRHSVENIVKFFNDNGASVDISSITTEHGNVSGIGACGHKFNRRLQSARSSAKSFGEINCTDCNYASRSLAEEELSKFVKSLRMKVIDGFYIDKRGKGKFEADVYVPCKKMAFEYHGLNWHSERILKKKSRIAKNYHTDKMKHFAEDGIQTIQIFESEWTHKKDIIKSIILSKLGKSKLKIFARDCSVDRVDSREAREFFNKNHRQGHSNGFLYIGLKYENRIVACMSFGKSRFSNKYDTELLRFSTELNTSVVGGFSRLLVNAKRNMDLGTIVTYADLRFSNMDQSKTVYALNGFKHSHISGPNYFYFKKGRDILWSRNKFQKHKLENLLENFDPLKSEYENMLANKYDRIWDCGNHVYILDE